MREYLLVEPEAHYPERLTLGHDGTYGKGEFFGPDEVISLTSLGSLELRLAQVFELLPQAPETPAAG